MVSARGCGAKRSFIQKPLGVYSGTEDGAIVPLTPPKDISEGDVIDRQGCPNGMRGDVIEVATFLSMLLGWCVESAVDKGNLSGGLYSKVGGWLFNHTIPTNILLADYSEKSNAEAI